MEIDKLLNDGYVILPSVISNETCDKVKMLTCWKPHARRIHNLKKHTQWFSCIWQTYSQRIYFK